MQHDTTTQRSILTQPIALNCFWVVSQKCLTFRQSHWRFSKASFVMWFLLKFGVAERTHACFNTIQAVFYVFQWITPETQKTLQWFSCSVHHTNFIFSDFRFLFWDMNKRVRHERNDRRIRNHQALRFVPAPLLWIHESKPQWVWPFCEVCVVDRTRAHR